ncbi:hypothetical protein ACFV4N_36670, partial [Actinosynnema sp. NPDC059797]
MGSREVGGEVGGGFGRRDGHRVARATPATGPPPPGPLLAGHPRDGTARAVDGRLPFGPDLLVAPAHRPGRRSREAPLPSGARWTDTATGALHEGGQTLPVDAPPDRTPLF